MLYTGKGDKGDTYFFGSDERDLKSSLQAEALGSLDEVNSLIGLCRAKSKGDRKRKKKDKGLRLSDILEQVQQDLFIIQAAIAGSNHKMTKEKTVFLESVIDSIEKQLPPIKTFFLSGGTELSGLLDYTRTVARRTERAVVRYSKMREIAPEILQYLNRLSSLLYALVRFVNLKAGVKETPPNYK